MKKSNSGSFNGIIPGILFAVLGVVLLVISPKSAIVWSIAIADLLFGVVLVVLSFVTKKNAENEEDEQDSFTAEPTKSAFDDDFDSDLAPTPVPAEEDDFDAPLEVEDPNAELIEREKELREARRLAVRDAKQAQEEAAAAIEKARQAEDALIEAEIAADSLSGDAQFNALMKVDDLANASLEASQLAASKERAATAAIERARQAMAAHEEVNNQLKAAGVSAERPAAASSRFNRY